MLKKTLCPSTWWDTLKNLKKTSETVCEQGEVILLKKKKKKKPCHIRIILYDMGIPRDSELNLDFQLPVNNLRNKAFLQENPRLFLLDKRLAKNSKSQGLW